MEEKKVITSEEALSKLALPEIGEHEVSVGLSSTINLGDYNNVKPEVSVSIKCKDPAEGYKFAKRFVELAFNDRVSKLKKLTREDKLPVKMKG